MVTVSEVVVLAALTTEAYLVKICDPPDSVWTVTGLDCWPMDMGMVVTLATEKFAPIGVIEIGDMTVNWGC